MSARAIFRTAVVAATVAVSCAARARAVTQQHAEAYDAHLMAYGISRANDTVGRGVRQTLFVQRLHEIDEHNRHPANTWTKGRNHMMDWTEAEFRRLLGHRPLMSSRARDFAAPASGPASLLEVREAFVAHAASWEGSVDWTRQHPELLKQVQNQGACGGCWAAAAVGALHANALIQKVPDVGQASYEYLVSCVPNPHKCGGNGGCSGDTAEGAMDFMSKFGVPLAKDFHGYLSQPTGEAPKCDRSLKPAYRMTGFTRLPTNRYGPLMSALNNGAVVLSVDASTWSMYSGGVMQCGEGNKITNHAVLGLGYGVDDKSGTPYFLIRNSWSSTWGENGFIRLRRRIGDINGGDGNCGPDTNPQAGTACEGAPSSVMACGDCGILMDSAVPGDILAVAQ